MVDQACRNQYVAQGLSDALAAAECPHHPQPPIDIVDTSGGDPPIIHTAFRKRDFHIVAPTICTEARKLAPGYTGPLRVEGSPIHLYRCP